MRFATLLVSLPASTLCGLRWVILLRLCFRIVQSEEGGEHKNSWSSRGWIVPFLFRCFNSLHQLVHLSCSWSATVVLVSDPALVVVPASSLFVSSMKNARDAERVYDPKQERPETRSYTWHSLLDSMIQHVSCRMSVSERLKYFWISSDSRKWRKNTSSSARWRWRSHVRMCLATWDEFRVWSCQTLWDFLQCTYFIGKFFTPQTAYRTFARARISVQDLI